MGSFVADPDTDAHDRRMMERAIALARRSGEDGEYPYGAVITRSGEVVVQSINRVAHEQDVTRHAEVVAISEAQKALGATSLEDCTIYVNAEPCAYCCYAIRESRIGRVVYGLRSPHMGGVSKWNVLADDDLSDTMPEVFAPPPLIRGGLMCPEAERALEEWNPVAWAVMKQRGLFTAEATLEVLAREQHRPRVGLHQWGMALLRRHVFDRFGRRP
jgi:tRNA(adenine34) deaminase